MGERGVVDHEHLRAGLHGAAGAEPSRQVQHPPRAPVVLARLPPAGVEDLQHVAHVPDRAFAAQPLEVLPPVRLVLPAVVVQRGSEQRARRRRHPAEQRLGQLAPLPLLRRLLQPGPGRASRSGRTDQPDPVRLHPDPVRLHPDPVRLHLAPAGGQRCVPLGEQPVPQPHRGQAVVPVVLGQLGHLRLEPVMVTGRAQLLGPYVGEHGVATGGDAVGVAQLVPHVQRLELLDRVGPLGDAHRVLHAGVQVHEHAGVDELGHLRHPDLVLLGEPPQRCRLVGGVVVDVHARMLLPPPVQVVQEVAQRPALRGPVVRPERHVALVAVGLQQPEQVLQPPPGPVSVHPERVALEVEEHIALVRGGERLQRRQVVHLGEHRRVQAGGLGLLLTQLQPGLRLQPPPHPRVQPGRRALGRGELLDRGDARGAQRCAVLGPQPPDQLHVPAGGHRLLAVVAPQAGGVPLVPPPHRLPARVVRIQQTLHVRAVLPVHGDAVGHVLGGDRAVAQVQHRLGRHADAGREQLVGVGGQLQHRARSHRARQLRVHDGVAHPSVGAHGALQEVRAAVEPAVEEATLEHHVRARPQCRQGPLGVPPQARCVVTLRQRDLHHAVAVACPVVGEHPRLVLITQPGGPFPHRVHDLQAGAAAELLVQPGEQGELAVSGQGQVAGAVDQSVVQQEHGFSSIGAALGAGGRGARRPPMVRLSVPADTAAGAGVPAGAVRGRPAPGRCRRGPQVSGRCGRGPQVSGRCGRGPQVSGRCTQGPQVQRRRPWLLGRMRRAPHPAPPPPPRSRPGHRPPSRAPAAPRRHNGSRRSGEARRRRRRPSCPGSPGLRPGSGSPGRWRTAPPGPPATLPRPCARRRPAPPRGRPARLCWSPARAGTPPGARCRGRPGCR